MPHILVVDDEPSICELMQIALEGSGSCRVTMAVSGEQALSVLMRDRPDAVIVDAVLPKTSGLGIANVAVHFGIPVLIVTGDPETAEKLDEVGCPFLWKPFHINTMVAEARALLVEASLRRAEVAMSLRRLANSVEDLRVVLDQAREIVHAIAKRQAWGISRAFAGL